MISLKFLWYLNFPSVNSSATPFPNGSIETDNQDSFEDMSETEEPDHIHRVKINTHGRKLNLKLTPIQHLLSKRSALDDNTWFADGYPSNVSYTPSPKVNSIFLMFTILGTLILVYVLRYLSIHNAIQSRIL